MANEAEYGMRNECATCKHYPVCDRDELKKTLTKDCPYYELETKKIVWIKFKENR